MSLDEKFAPVRTIFYNIVGNFFQKIAELFGYPTNPGMPTLPNLNNEASARSQFLASLPSHKTFWPPIETPTKLVEVLFGTKPNLQIVPRYIYESKEEGFYNFYIENYKNIYFLPDWFSEFLQLQFNICLDIQILETIREVLFVGLMVYSQIVILRIALAWYIYINPYTVPWCYLVAAVDWTEDVLQGIIPSILGINITASVFLGILGALADSLNHLVFTMPFLPSEGEEIQLLINQKMKDVIVFHYLPILWYRYPIPNKIREFWYNQRPDILDYMQKAYKDLDIRFLPDSIVETLNQENYTVSLNSTIISPEMNLQSYCSTELLSSNHLIFMPEIFHSLFLNNIETLL